MNAPAQPVIEARSLVKYFGRTRALDGLDLTVAPGEPASHRRQGWEEITGRAIEALVERERPLVAILWGRQAQSLEPMLGNTPVIASAHPSPLSARSGFFGSRPFSRANAALTAQGADPIDWRLS